MKPYLKRWFWMIPGAIGISVVNLLIIHGTWPGWVHVLAIVVTPIYMAVWLWFGWQARKEVK